MSGAKGFPVLSLSASLGFTERDDGSSKKEQVCGRDFVILTCVWKYRTLYEGSGFRNAV